METLNNQLTELHGSLVRVRDKFFIFSLRLVSRNPTEIAKLLQRYGIEHHKSSPYRPQANGAIEAANKNVKRILSKMVKTYKDWSEHLPFALWGYRTTTRTATRQTPFFLVYGSEAVLPIETEIKSLRVVVEAKTPESE